MRPQISFHIHMEYFVFDDLFNNTIIVFKKPFEKTSL